jgi:hypothetical protein
LREKKGRQTMESPQPSGGRPYYDYSVPLIGTLSGAYVLVVLLALASVASTAAIIDDLMASLFLAILATVALLDWRGLLSLRGLVNWSAYQGGKRVLVICLYVIGFALVLSVYLGRAALEAWRARSVAQPLVASIAIPATQSVTTRLRTTRGGFATLGVVFIVMLMCYGITTAGASPDTTASRQTRAAATTGGNSAQTVATSTPTVKPTATPTVAPTATATQKPCANPCNPWGYNFSKGKLIYDPPSDFCSYFDCIDNFWNGRGYVMECRDTSYSKSGGISGSCSYHNGNWRPLYSH